MHGSHFKDLLKHSMIHSIFHLVLVSSLQCVVFLGLLVFVMQIDVGQGIPGRNMYDTRYRSMLCHLDYILAR